MAHHTHTVEIRNPGPFRVSPTMKTVFGISALVGVIATVAALVVNPARAWPNYLLNFFFFFGLSLFGGLFTAIQHVTNAYWSVTARRLAEGLMAFLPLAALLVIPLFIGSHHLYEWTHADVVANDHVLTLKHSYLNPTAWIIRTIVILGLLLILSFKLCSNSVAQDSDGADRHTLANIKLSTAFIPVFGVGFTLMAVDLVMSLEPHWYSTIYGVYCFAGMFVAGFALLAIMLISGRRQGLFTNEMLNENHIHDVGKFMFAFTIFWGYIMFAQLMLIWYANLPEETVYYLRRFHGGWWTFSVVLFMVQFVVPFFGLLPRGAKRNDGYLKKMALVLLAAHWLDVYYLVMPVFFKEGPVFGWIEIGTFLGFFGLFGITIGRYLEKVPAIPYKDPRLADCVAHSQ